ncbi:MAG: DUF3908 family protein [Turicibacter sp.]
MITINLLKHLASHHLNQQAITLTYMINELSQFIILTEATLIYPRNLNQNNEEFELYIFDERGQIFKVTYQAEVTKIETYYKNQIKNIIYESGLDRTHLEIEFLTGMKINFTPDLDTVAIHRKELNLQLKRIYKALLDSTIFE